MISISFFALFNSAHRVMQAESILKQCGFAVRMIPAPRPISTDCGLAIRYNKEISDAVFEKLTDSGLPPETIYKSHDSMNFVVVWQQNQPSNAA